MKDCQLSTGYELILSEKVYAQAVNEIGYALGMSHFCRRNSNYR